MISLRCIKATFKKNLRKFESPAKGVKPWLVFTNSVDCAIIDHFKMVCKQETRMAGFDINVVGIMIDTHHKDFKLYKISESRRSNTQDGTDDSLSTSNEILIKGLGDITRYLSISPNVNTQFVIVYNVSCPNREAQVKILLARINKIIKNNLSPTLISIGHEQSSWVDDIKSLFSEIKEVKNKNAGDDFFKSVIQRELYHIKKQFIGADKQLNPSADKSPLMPEEKPSSMSNISMMILGGFISAVGIAAVATALTMLNAGALGLFVAGIGVATALSGVGLFFVAQNERHTTPYEVSLNQSNSTTPVHI